MKLNIAYPAYGSQKVVEVEDENKLRAFYDRRMCQEVDGSSLGDDFKGYTFRITGGNDKQGFPMKQGLMTTGRVRLLLSNGHTCYRIRKDGERKRKSVRGCIVSSELSVLNLVVVKKGEKEIPHVTDTKQPRRHGPKRASNIRRLFNLSKEDDVRTYNIKRKITKDGQKPYYKRPKIQRLITPSRLQRKRHEAHVQKERYERSQKIAREYTDLLNARFKEARDKRAVVIAKRRSASTRKSASEAAAAKRPPSTATAVAHSAKMPAAHPHPPAATHAHAHAPAAKTA